MPTRPVFFVGVIAIAVVATATFAQGIRWEIVNWKVRHDFPNVRHIEPNQLAGLAC